MNVIIYRAEEGSETLDLTSAKKLISRMRAESAAGKTGMTYDEFKYMVTELRTRSRKICRIRSSCALGNVQKSTKFLPLPLKRNMRNQLREFLFHAWPINYFTRPLLTNAFSKQVKYLKAAGSLHFGFYNFCRVPLGIFAQRELRITFGPFGN